MENSEPNFYNYEALHLLIDNIDEYLIENVVKNIKIFAYEIKNNSKYPYIKYLLTKNLQTDTLFFPEIEVSNFKLNTEKIITLAKLNVFTLLSSDNYDDYNDYNDYDKNIQVKGFHLNNEEIYIIIDLTDCNLEIVNKSKNNSIWFCLIDEIMNHNSICNTQIEKNTTNFFNNNVEFCFLKNKNGDNYEIPCVGYVGINKNKINFTYVFGVSKKDCNAIVGPYYYFTDFNNSIQQCELININNNYAAIVRFALFLGKIKVIENSINDEIDNSELKKERLLDCNLDNILEELTTRISDYDGKWTEYYDSVYLGQVKLDNDEYLNNTPIFVVKEYEQQVPLSYHYIDKRLLA
jgi:hypothetical protein